jgi:hypothetical protein
MTKPTLEMQVVNLRMQLDVLEKATKGASLPEAVTQIRNTVQWSAILISVALVGSSLIRMFDTSEVKTLEKRIQILERYYTEKPLRGP